MQKYDHMISVTHHNTVTYGDKSLTALGPKIWNKLLTNIKSLTSITKFKEYIRGLGLVANVTFAEWLKNLFIYSFLTVLTFL